MKITKLPIDKVIPYTKNVKRHSEQQVENIAKSIKDVGFVQPLVVDEKNVIIIGHGRYEAMKLIGEKEIDCVVLTGLTDTQKKSLRIKDNKLNESPYDISNLRDEVQILFDEGIDLQDLGFSLKELEDFNLEIEKLEETSEVEDLLDEAANTENSANLGGTEYINGEKKIAYQFSNVQGNQNGVKTPLTFYLNEEENRTIGEFFKTTHKWEANVPLLIEVVNFYIDNHEE